MPHNDNPGSDGRTALEEQIAEGFTSGQNSKAIARQIKHWPSHTLQRPKRLTPRQVLVISTRMCRVRGLSNIKQLIAQVARKEYVHERDMLRTDRRVRDYRKSAKSNAETISA